LRHRGGGMAPGDGALGAGCGAVLRPDERVPLRDRWGLGERGPRRDACVLGSCRRHYLSIAGASMGYKT
jgi:hypothetical protein